MELKSFTPVRGPKSYWADFVKEVTSGAALLDVIAPGWAEVIDIPKLDLSRADQCVLGQVWMHQELFTPALRQVVTDLDLDDQLDFDFAGENQFDDLCMVISNYAQNNDGLEAVEKQHGEFDPATYGFDLPAMYVNHEYAKSQCKCPGGPREGLSFIQHEGRCPLKKLYNLNWRWEQLGFAWMAEIEARKEALAKEATT